MNIFVISKFFCYPPVINFYSDVFRLPQGAKITSWKSQMHWAYILMHWAYIVPLSLFPMCPYAWTRIRSLVFGYQFSNLFGGIFCDYTYFFSNIIIIQHFYTAGYKSWYNCYEILQSLSQKYWADRSMHLREMLGIISVVRGTYIV